MSAEPFRVVVADPPWKFGDSLPGKKRGAAKHYGVLGLDEIKAFPLPPVADDALLFLWRVSAMATEAYEVARAWGFEPKAEIVWIKTAKGGAGLHFGMGRYVRNCHETCIIARRGRAKVRDKGVRSVFYAGTTGRKHSAKPAKFYALVEQLTLGPYAELFARARRPNWTSFGDEVDGPREVAAE